MIYLIQSVKTFAKNLMGLTNRLDVLVNNAGMAGDLGARLVLYSTII